MHRKWLVMVMSSLSLVFLACIAFLAAEAEPQVGQIVANAKFSKPLSAEDAKYLGLDKVTEFTIKDIKAPFVLVEQMNNT